MVTLVLAGVLAASGMDVVAVRGDARSVEGALAGQLPNMLDASRLHSQLFQDDSMMGPDFEAFTAPPVEGWPDSLKPAWVSGVAHCRAIAGPPPWKGPGALATAMTCGTRLAGWLWEKYLGSVNAKRSLVVTVFNEGMKSTVTLRLWEVGATNEWVEQFGCTRGDREPEVTRRLARVLAHEAKSEPHPTTTEFTVSATSTATAQSPSELVQGPAVTTPVALKQRCDSLPAALTFTGRGPTAESITARWPAAAKGTGAARACSLAMTQHDEAVGVMPITVVQATLTCGQTTVSVEAAKSPPERSGVDVLSDKLMQAFAAQLCR